MKKSVFFAAVAIVAACTFTSCQKNCTCTEASTGVSSEIPTDGQFKNCQDIQDYMNETAMGTQDWTCQ